MDDEEKVYLNIIRFYSSWKELTHIEQFNKPYLGYIEKFYPFNDLVKCWFHRKEPSRQKKESSRYTRKTFFKLSKN